MESVFNQSKWIWAKDSLCVDDYAQFIDCFSCDENNVLLRISCDTCYAIYLNNILIKFMLCSDFPEDKFYDEVKLSVNKGINELRIDVWHYGKDFHTAIKDEHGLIYEIVNKQNKIIACSNQSTKSRVINEFKNGYEKLITSQQGYSFYFDNTIMPSNFDESITIENKCNFSKREINNIALIDRLPIKLIKKEKSIIVDLGKETAGIVDLDFVSDIEQEIKFYYGEHLKDGGHVLKGFDGGEFSFEFKAKKGKNVFLNPLKRIAGRYIEIFSKQEIKINYIGIRPVTYMHKVKRYEYDDPVINKINEICLNTLDCCMHEHYEDCPWREQSLYTLDMRNQMLIGYSVYEGFEYQRHNLLLNSKGLSKFGLISLCVPSNIELPIPSFSLHYIIAVKEYLENTNDLSVLPIVKPVIQTIVKTMLDRVDKTGLIHYFPKPYWNFYEWTDESHNNDDICAHLPVKDQYDLIINALFVYIIPIYNQLFNEHLDVEGKKAAIQKMFYDETKGVYLLSNRSKKYSQLGNVLAYSIGLGDNTLLDKILNDPEMITISLSMKGFLYDALLNAGGKYSDYIIKDIKDVYSQMLEDGATSCYEAAINVSGLGINTSLCHAWSALPSYYFGKLLKGRKIYE